MPKIPFPKSSQVPYGAIEVTDAAYSAASTDEVLVSTASGAGVLATPAELLTLPADITLADGAYDFDVAAHDGTNGLLLGGVLVAASAAEINRPCDVSARLVSGGASLTLSAALHDGKTVLWDTAADTALTLPAATGTGARFRCVVSVLLTGTSYTLSCAGTDEFQGSIAVIETDNADATINYAALAGDDFDVITLNKTTTGIGAVGDWVEVEDVVTGVWAVNGVIRAVGSATPFSST